MSNDDYAAPKKIILFTKLFQTARGAGKEFLPKVLETGGVGIKIPTS